MADAAHLYFQHKPPRIARFVRMVDAFERDEIEAAVDMLIARLDERDGDPDVEANGDERDCTDSVEEDTPLYAFGPGDGYAGDPDNAEDGDEDCCAARDDEPRSGLVPSAMRTLDNRDPGSEDDEEPAAWIEWTTRGRHKLEFGGERLARDRHRNAAREDDEDCDPPEQDDEPEDEHDLEAVNEDGCEGALGVRPIYGPDQSTGPLNGMIANRKHIARQAGLVRSPSGGWRHPISLTRGAWL